MTAIDTTAPIATLSENGRNLMTAIGELKFSFFDEGVNEGSGSWGNCLSEEAVSQGITASVRSTAGILGRLVKLEMLYAGHAVGEGDEGQWYALTAVGAAVARDLAAEATSEPAEEPIVTETVEHASVEQIDAAIEAGEASVKPLTRKQLLEIFSAKGYTGPTSYLLPKLREIAAGL